MKLNTVQKNFIGLTLVSILALIVHTQLRISYVNRNFDYRHYGPVVQASMETEKFRLMKGIVRRHFTYGAYAFLCGALLVFLARGEQD